MKQETKQRTVSAVTSLLVLAVFSVSILGVLLAGAQAYQRLTGLGNTGYDSRTCCAYIASRFRQAAGGVAVESFGDGDCLAFYEELEGKSYVTRVYCYDGWLRELFTVAGPDFDPNDFAPRDGEKVLPLAAAEFDLTDGLVTMRLTPESGAVAESAVLLRAGEGGGA